MHVKNKLEEKDINRYTFRQLKSTMDTIFNITLDNNNTDETVNSDEVKVLYDGPLGKLAIPLTEEASCILGRGTKWCTAANKDNMFDAYNKEGPLYIWRDKSGEKYQFHFNTMQFMNDKDEPISTEQLNYFRTENAVTKKLFTSEEQKMIDSGNASQCMDYAIAIGSRFLLGEPTIADSGDSYTCVEYAKNVIGSRFLLGEPTIITDFTEAMYYMDSFFKHGERFIPLEEYMVTNKQHTDICNYSQKIKQRIPELEKCLLEYKSAYYLVKYVQDVIKGDWPEAEPYIKKNIRSMADYCAAVKHRIKEWEPTIKTNHYAWSVYVKYVGVPLGELKQMRRDEEKNEEN